MVPLGMTLSKRPDVPLFATCCLAQASRFSSVLDASDRRCFCLCASSWGELVLTYRYRPSMRGLDRSACSQTDFESGWQAGNEPHATWLSITIIV
jgi:hypothetical protein